ncbi:histamine H2 receptor-like [Actinia tenebrosa]|uniref:Histamine H2 receptor-like n=1 Tax=Actinia tenebrosa TaxID=6105 RepID=A0A6P8IR30_ACTTE|nr:histamine H2 receptor-like [Actinia tenebrosa]
MENRTNIKVCMFVQLDKAAVQDAYASYIANIVLNSSLALPTIIFNFIVLGAIWKTTSLHTPSNMLIFSLALSDFLIGAITEPFYVAYKASEINDKFDEYCEIGIQVVALFFIYFLAAVSFATLTVMSIDRYLAIHLGMRYRLVVTPSRVAKTLVLLWLFGILLSSLQLFLAPKMFSRVASLLMALFLAIMCFAYIKAFRALKQHQSQMASNASQSYMSKIRIEKFRRTLYAVLYILGLILLCYVPHFCVFIAISATGLNSATRAAKNLANPFVLANSCLNPPLYWWKIKEIRRACRNVFCKTFSGRDNYSTTSDNGVFGNNKMATQSSSGGALELSLVAEPKVYADKKL